jgi:hypothetical protein
MHPRHLKFDLFDTTIITTHVNEFSKQSLLLQSLETVKYWMLQYQKYIESIHIYIYISYLYLQL